MLEYIAAQTQVLQAMAQTMVKIHQSITKQTPLPKDHIRPPMITIKT
jgi:hypothetical protein